MSKRLVIECSWEGYHETLHKDLDTGEYILEGKDKEGKHRTNSPETLNAHQAATWVDVREAKDKFDPEALEYTLKEFPDLLEAYQKEKKKKKKPS